MCAPSPEESLLLFLGPPQALGQEGDARGCRARQVTALERTQRRAVPPRPQAHQPKVGHLRGAKTRMAGYK